jgi:cytochrome c oxidase cbb3-type subunit II
MSWFGYVFRSQAELSRLEPYKDPVTSVVYPIARSGAAQQGAEVYREQGCAACHTQQVRAAGEGNDIQRAWGIRRTVASDYMLENPPLLGAIRLGPDLSNIGLRKSTNDIVWHYKHLLNPRSVVDKSTMPRYPYLFEKRKTDAPGAFSIPSEPNTYFIPKDEAKSLVAYLLSLRTDGPVFEAPISAPPSTNAPAGDTNAPAATNAAATTTSTTNAPAK